MRGIVAALLLTSAGGFATRRTLLRLSVQSRGVPDSAAPPAPSLRSDVASFKVMDVVESAQALEAEGHRVYHLEVGQPSTGAPAAVKRAAARALDTEKLGYTQSKGIPELREAIIKHYYEVGGIPEGSLDPERLVITTGSSGGFLLAFAACFDKDDHVAVGSTCYPCYRNILESMDCHPAIIQLNKEFKLTATQLRAEVERRKDAGLPPLKGVIQSSPSNPTGSTLTPAEVEEMCAFCAAEGMWFLSDEIYHGINFGEQAASALRFPQYADNVMVLNSFSKYFSMTGWRLGWMVSLL
uniref:Aminotransferase class I/classII large domain-containing protein n=1 Tax=Phaeomonas parva TaxID=124430 RepID=A0A6U4FYL8_9STRA|mmetsp:Transcript_28029/g.89467  ORF Transcript_28029/g.89467 Transcript_28029/m.89467 type:complete len:297 (+) Transcript_28029:186-1076(+)